MAEQEPQPDVDQCPAEAQGGWDHNEAAAQSCTQPSWGDTEAAQESWDADQGSAAQPYTEPSWDDDGSNVGQGGWGDAGEQVELGGYREAGGTSVGFEINVARSRESLKIW